MSDRPLRVAFFGNVANALFQVASALRADGRIDAHLYVQTGDVLSNRPESADPALAGGAPWIHDAHWITPASVLLPWRAPITRELASYDLVVVSGPGPIFAQFAGRPWCWWVSGGDLTVKPFPITFWRRYHGWRHRVGEVIGGMWQRRAARRATQLWVQPFAPMQEALQRLHVPPERVSSRYFPLIIDTEMFDPARAGTTAPTADLEQVRDAGFVVFHPSRMLLTDSPDLRRTGQWKANDVLIEGFASFVQHHPDVDALLVMPDGEMSLDLAAAKTLVNDLGIGHAVLWARPDNATGFNRHQLLDFYQEADVVGVDFGIGWFGFVALEGAAMAKPVLNHIDERAMAMLYPDGHPFCNARTPDEVAVWLGRLHDDPHERQMIGDRSRHWVLRHHGIEAARRTYADEIAAVVNELGVGQP
jgi:glycosyltransferase involved in cell wall biosynthesis